MLKFWETTMLQSWKGGGNAEKVVKMRNGKLEVKGELTDVANSLGSQPSALNPSPPALSPTLSSLIPHPSSL
eukprot:3941051-Rhodomonas_salina.1